MIVCQTVMKDFWINDTKIESWDFMLIVCCEMLLGDQWTDCPVCFLCQVQDYGPLIYPTNHNKKCITFLEILENLIDRESVFPRPRAKLERDRH